MWRKLLVLALLVSGRALADETQLTMDEKLRKLEEETKATEERSQRVMKFYQLEVGETLRDITADILASSDTAEAQKNAIQAHVRRIYIFEYPSGSFKVKGYISFIPDGQPHPLLVNLRGGNRLFGIPYPGSDFACARDYTVIATTYRGGVSEGTDEYGGSDVDDVKHLIGYIPELEHKLQASLASDKLYMLGASRGGMQMFLALARCPELQQRVVKIVALCGLLDIRETLVSRPDLKEMFAKEFGYQENDNGDEWINQRDPLVAVEKLRSSLPVFIIQATADLRVGLKEGYTMVRKLEERGNPVTYLEVPGADHCLFGLEDRVDIVLDWLESQV